MKKKKITHVDDDAALEDAVRGVRDDIALLLEARSSLGLVADGAVDVLPLVVRR